ncbi:hypothetical protein C8R43DRAFT_1121139 [Mycena crocata]|nr:hypothetical protein C8R43DRAFT_1121139 [Mycena crocata]
MRLSPPSGGLSLDTLNIHSAVLILPPDLRWTLQALRSTSSLTLSKYLLSYDVWGVVLPLAKEGHNLTPNPTPSSILLPRLAHLELDETTAAPLIYISVDIP